MPLASLTGDAALSFGAVPATNLGTAASLVEIAFGSTFASAEAAWVNVDGNCVSWQTDRGRRLLTDQTQAGTAQITLVDSAGLYDMLNTAGPHWQKIEPLKRIRIREVNPMTGTTHIQFTGVIDEWDWEVDVAERQLTITIQCVDNFETLAANEVVPGPTGEAVYARQQVDDAIRARLADAGWAPALAVVYSGNVYIKPTAYQAGTDTLSTLAQCVEAEFAGGPANHYMSKGGIYTFHGRLARFNPTDPQYGISSWLAGDERSAVGGAWARIAELGWCTMKDHVVNVALFTPEGIQPADIAGQLVTDPSSIAARGARTMKQEGLLTDGNVNTLNTDLQETKLMATWWVDNWAVPHAEIEKLTFKTLDPDDPDNAATHALMVGVEISDLVSVVNTNPGGGGFNAAFFVEGIHQTAALGSDRMLQRTCSLDVSPQSLYDSNPF